MERSFVVRFRAPDSTESFSMGRPYVTLNAAITLDGKIATRSRDSRISSANDLKELHKMRSTVDAVMIGIRTVLSDDPRLTVRKAKGKDPARVVVDSFARTPLDARILTTGGGMVIIAVSRSAPGSRVKRLEHAGANVLSCGARKVNLKVLLRRLYRMGIRRILLEGGGGLNWSMLKSQLVDEIRVTVAPLIVGGEEAVTLVEGIGMKRMDDAIRLSLMSVAQNGGEVTLTYRVGR